MYTQLFPDDHLVFYAIVQNRRTQTNYLNARTYLGKNYFCVLESIPHEQPKTFMFRFRRTNSVASNVKHIDKWDVFRYEIYSPYPDCSLSKNAESISDYLSCERFDSDAFYIDVKHRGSSSLLLSLNVIQASLK